MPKPNAMLARIEAAAKARYQARLHTSMDMLLQLGQDAGPGRAEKFLWRTEKLSTIWPAVL